jgi:hypothetical protein
MVRMMFELEVGDPNFARFAGGRCGKILFLRIVRDARERGNAFYQRFSGQRRHLTPERNFRKPHGEVALRCPHREFGVAALAGQLSHNTVGDPLPLWRDRAPKKPDLVSRDPPSVSAEDLIVAVEAPGFQRGDTPIPQADFAAVIHLLLVADAKENADCYIRPDCCECNQNQCESRRDVHTTSSP